VRIAMNGERVLALREEWGMSRQTCAAAAGVSVATVRRAEGGEPVRPRTARRVAAALGLRPSRGLGRVLR